MRGSEAKKQEAVRLTHRQAGVEQAMGWAAPAMVAAGTMAGAAKHRRAGEKEATAVAGSEEEKGETAAAAAGAHEATAEAGSEEGREETAAVEAAAAAAAAAAGACNIPRIR